MLVPDRPHWHADAKCHGMTQIMYPTREAKTAEEARAICQTCPVQEPCLEYALSTGEKFGIFGGLSEKQRRRIRRQRQQHQLEHEERSA